MSVCVGFFFYGEPVASKSYPIYLPPGTCLTICYSAFDHHGRSLSTVAEVLSTHVVFSCLIVLPCGVVVCLGQTDNRIKHSKPGTVETIPERKKKVVKELT